MYVFIMAKSLCPKEKKRIIYYYGKTKILIIFSTKSNFCYSILHLFLSLSISYCYTLFVFVSPILLEFPDAMKWRSKCCLLQKDTLSGQTCNSKNTRFLFGFASLLRLLKHIFAFVERLFHKISHTKHNAKANECGKEKKKHFCQNQSKSRKEWRTLE